MIDSLTNIGYAILANAQAAWLVLVNLSRDELFLGFAGGSILTLIIIGFMLTSNPRTIPFMIRYSFPDCFFEADNHFKKKAIACNISFLQFHKAYVRMRILLGMGITLFMSITIAAVYLQR